MAVKCVEDRKRGGRFDSLGQLVAVKCVEDMTGNEKADGLIVLVNVWL